MNGESKKVALVLPCFNEVTTISDIIFQIIGLGWDKETFEIIVVDDGSKDGTQELLVEIAKNHPQIKLYINNNRIGLGKSIYQGIKKTNSDYIILMDTDGMHDPRYLDLMLNTAHMGANLVIGSRYVKGANFQGALYPFMSRLVNILIRTIMKSKVKDQLCGFFLADSIYLKSINEEFFIGFGEYFISIIKYFEIRGLKVVEIPSVHKVRKSGRRKSQRLKMLISYLNYAFRVRKKIASV